MKTELENGVEEPDFSGRDDTLFTVSDKILLFDLCDTFLPVGVNAAFNSMTIRLLMFKATGKEFSSGLIADQLREYFELDVLGGDVDTWLDSERVFSLPTFVKKKGDYVGAPTSGGGEETTPDKDDGRSVSPSTFSVSTMKDGVTPTSSSLDTGKPLTPNDTINSPTLLSPTALASALPATPNLSLEEEAVIIQPTEGKSAGSIKGPVQRSSCTPEGEAAPAGVEEEKPPPASTKKKKGVAASAKGTPSAPARALKRKHLAEDAPTPVGKRPKRRKTDA